MATVTKHDLVVRISDKVGITQREASEVIEQLMLEITDSLTHGNDVVFRNFGTFHPAINKAKVGRNPKRPEVEIEIPARKVVRFKSGKALKEQIASAPIEKAKSR